MSAPLVTGSIATQSITVGSSTPITLPSGIVAGERLVVALAWDNGDNATIAMSIATGVGWTIKGQTQTSAVNSAVVEKLSAAGDASDALTLSFTGLTIGEVGNVIALRIGGNIDPAQTLEWVEQSFVDIPPGAISANVDPPNITPSWGALSTNLYVAIAAWDNATRTLTSYPTNYSANQLTNRGPASSASVGIALATRELAAGSENPGAFVISSDDQWDAWTLAFKPLGGGDTTAPVLTSPVGTATGATTATVGATTNEGNGTLFAFVSTSATPPTASVLKAGTGAAWAGSQTVTATGARTLTATGLTASTGYYAHLIHTDAAGNDSNIVSSALFTTSTPDTTPPTLTSPTGTGGPLTASGTVTTNEAGGTLFAVVTGSATPPSVSQVKAGQDNTGAAALRAVSQAVTASGLQTIASGAVTAGTRYFYYVHTDGSGNDSTVAASASFEVTSTSNNIRLQPGIELERGARAASRTLNRWWVLTPDLASISATGTSITTDTEGRPTININASAHFVVGDNVPVIFGEWTSEANPLDRTVRSGLMWVPAIAQA